MSEFLLTAAQQAAVEDHGGAVLVSAAAGSGKTRVLVERLMRQICDAEHPHDVDEFLIITFTKKAAAELRTRIAKDLSERLAASPDNRHLQRQLHRIYLAKISTIHAFCSDLLHEFAYQLRLPADFRQAEESELDTLRQKLVSKLLDESYTEPATAEGLRQLADLLGSGRNDRAVAELILSVYDETRCHLSEEAWIRFCLNALDTSGLSDAAQTVWGCYLIDNLHRAVSDCLSDYETVNARLAEDPVLSSRYLPAFSRDAKQLRALLDATTWDEIAVLGAPDFERLGSSKGCENAELMEQAKLVRELCKKKISALLSAFYAPSETVFAEAASSADALRCLFALVRAFAERFRAEKERLHLQDFNDLEHGAVQLLLQKDTYLPTRIAKELSERFTEIMVDEYQDTNEVQDAIFKAISKEGKNRFMVGDVKQSVYRFRLADPTIFLRKYKTYRDHREAAPGESRKILLSENFRSGGEILEAANAVFSSCMSEQVGDLVYGAEEALVQGIAHTPLPYPPVELHCIVTAADTEEESPKKNAAEAAFVAARIRQLLDSQTPVREHDTLRPVRPGDIVILLRSLKNNAQYYLDALSAQGIGAVCDNGASILSSEALEALTSLLQILDNAHQDIPLASAMLSPVFGFSADTLASARAKRRDLDLYDAVCEAAQTDDRFRSFLDTVQTLRSTAQALPLHTLLEEIEQHTGMEAVYGAMPDAETNLAGFRRFRELAAAFEDGGKRGLREFLVYLEALKARGVTVSAAGTPSTVTIMSIHKSKGLEFPVVVLADLSRRFNTDDAARPVLLHPQFGAAGNIYDEALRVHYPSAAKKAIAAKLRADSLSEELRVLYVAMTRPQDMLIMTYCAANPRERLRDLAGRLSMTSPAVIAKDAVCPGDWVLTAALQRTEAEALFNYAQAYPETSLSDSPWRICLHEGISDSAAAGCDEVPDKQTAPVDLRMLSFRYPSSLAVQVPSKVTATQLKGRLLDHEVAEGSAAAGSVHFRQPPLFLEDRPLSPTERGIAAHLAMQYLDFDKTGSEADLASELHRLVRDRFLTQQQADAVSPAKLLNIFAGPIGTLIRSADRVIREFKFSVLVDADRYFKAEPGEKMLLQGVTDCCLVKDGALTVIDFKTDRILPGEEQASAEHYTPQLEAYSLALSRIFKMPVSKRILYYFQTDTAVEV